MPLSEQSLKEGRIGTTVHAYSQRVYATCSGIEIVAPEHPDDPGGRVLFVKVPWRDLGINHVSFSEFTIQAEPRTETTEKTLTRMRKQLEAFNKQLDPLAKIIQEKFPEAIVSEGAIGTAVQILRKLEKQDA